MRTAFRTGVVVMMSVVGISAGGGDAQDKRRPQVRPGEPCCGIKSVDMRTKMVTVTEKATGCTYEFQAQAGKDLEGLKVGGAIDLDVKLLKTPAEPVGRPRGLAAKPAEPVGKPAEPAGRPAEPVGKPAEPASPRRMSAGASAACGSNVGRNAKTKTLCRVMTGPNSWEYRPC